uniref:SFRICE_003313 n=1 Tax=Spodoptera frugiperda TaxID=7108 RepID=A0A2H1V8X7_SPOFR
MSDMSEIEMPLVPTRSQPRIREDWEEKRFREAVTMEFLARSSSFEATLWKEHLASLTDRLTDNSAFATDVPNK